MSPSISVAIFGSGHIGVVHLQSALVMDGVGDVTVADVDSGRRRRAERLGATRVYDEYGALLEDADPDVVIVALPPSLHAEAALSAIDHGCHVFVEKPLARSVAEGQQLVAAAEAAGVALGVDHTLRYHPEMKRLKAQYEEGTLGHVPLAYLSRVNSGPFEAPPATTPIPGWQLNPGVTGGGAVMDLGIHLFDLLEWFFGDMTVEAAHLDNQLNLLYEDTAAVTLRSKATGTLATVHCGFYQWEEPPAVNLTFRLDGIAGSAESTDHVPNFYANAGKSAVTNVVKRLAGRTPDYYAPTYYYQAHFDALEAFIQAVRDGDVPPVSGADGVRSLELVEAVYRIADTHDEWHPIDLADEAPGDPDEEGLNELVEEELSELVDEDLSELVDDSRPKAGDD